MVPRRFFQDAYISVTSASLGPAYFALHVSPRGRAHAQNAFSRPSCDFGAQSQNGLQFALTLQSTGARPRKERTFM